jgi:hypothetical protein
MHRKPCVRYGLRRRGVSFLPKSGRGWRTGCGLRNREEVLMGRARARPGATRRPGPPPGRGRQRAAGAVSLRTAGFYMTGAVGASLVAALRTAASEGVARNGEPPPSAALPRKLRGGGRRTGSSWRCGRPARDRILPSPTPFVGEGSGMGGACRRSANDPTYRNPRPTQPPPGFIAGLLGEVGEVYESGGGAAGARHRPHPSTTGRLAIPHPADYIVRRRVLVRHPHRVRSEPTASRISAEA